MKYIYTLLFIVGLASFSTAQNSLWSLERCITHAQQNNLNIQQSSVAVKQSELNLKGNKREYHPSVNGSVSYNFNIGRSVDPTSNDFVSRSIHSNGFSVSAGALIYSGGRVPSTIQQSEFNIEAAKLDMQDTKNDIGLQVARAYLQILLAEEQLANGQLSIKQLEDQLAQTNKLIRAGTLPANNRLDIEAQIATSEQTLVANQNNVDISYLNLKLLLMLEPAAEFKIEKPTIDVPSADQIGALSVTSLFDVAVENQPNIAAGELRRKSAEKGIDIARSAYYPTVSVGGGLNTNYSNIALDQANAQVIPTGFDTTNTQVIFNGVSQNLGIVNPTFDLNIPKSSYFKQLGTNLSAFIGLQVNIPIYNKGLTEISIERAKLNVINTQYTNRILRQGLKSELLRAIADAKAAAKQLEASEKSIKAQEAAFANTQRRFEVGTANSFELNTARNNLDSAKTLAILAKYDYIFKLKIIDFYQGKSISLDK